MTDAAVYIVTIGTKWARCDTYAIALETAEQWARTLPPARNCPIRVCQVLAELEPVERYETRFFAGAPAQPPAAPAAWVGPRSLKHQDGL